MSGIKKFSELSKEELISRISLACCYKCEQFQDLQTNDGYWNCSGGCECVCCDSCIEVGDVDNKEIDENEDCGFYCGECKEKFLKEKEKEESDD